MTASNYDMLEMQTMKPSDSVEECYVQLQNEAYLRLEGDKFETLEQFV